MQRGLTVFGDEESLRNLKGLVQWAYCWITCCNIKKSCELLFHVRKNKDRYINRSSEDFEFHMNTRMNEYIMLILYIKIILELKTNLVVCFWFHHMGFGSYPLSSCTIPFIHCALVLNQLNYLFFCCCLFFELPLTLL
jgi:hypothetical protein